ncbi:hypothetical protein O23A_p1626 [Aeromonas salmonicida]|nr:hypothetical protein O23A_p1626 [Aeromonas salmonicida]
MAQPRTLIYAFNKAVKPGCQTVTKVTRFPVRLFENKYIN